MNLTEMQTPKKVGLNIDGQCSLVWENDEYFLEVTFGNGTTDYSYWDKKKLQFRFNEIREDCPNKPPQEIVDAIKFFEKT